VAFAPGGVLLATGSWDGTVKIWNVTTAQELSSLKTHGDKVHSIVFSPAQATKIEDDSAAWAPIAMG
jgi:WD40 repeat protein